MRTLTAKDVSGALLGIVDHEIEHHFFTEFFSVYRDNSCPDGEKFIVQLRDGREFKVSVEEITSVA